MGFMVTVTTADELLRLPRGCHRFELVRGELRTMSPAGADHSAVALRLGARLDAHVHRHALGRVFGADCGFRIESNPDTVLAPDAAFIGRSRLVGVDTRGFAALCPDLVVEVRSPSDSARAVRNKVQQWLRFGCRLAITVEPESQCATIHRPGVEPLHLGIDDAIDGGEVVPGFRLTLRELFAG
jgi:Uma2 family endonuclease